MKKIKLLLATVTLLLSTWVNAQSNPLPMLQSASDKILSTLEHRKASLQKNPQIIYQAVEKYLLPLVDVEGMSRSVLGRQAWVKASVNERQEFAQAFTRLVIRTYASPLAEYTDETVKFLPNRGAVAEGRFMRVNSIIMRSSGKNIPLNYNLVSKNGQWKIYDLSVEGVSLLQSFRSQFAQVLQNSNIQGLIKEMHYRSKADKNAATF